MTNRESFELICAILFERLHDRFPRPTELSMSDFLRDKRVPRLEAIPFLELESIYYHTLSWLSDEGIIRAKRTRKRVFKSVVLTMKGFALLESTPNALDPSERSVIEEIHSALENVSEKVAHQALSVAVRKFMSSIVFAG